jgi:hypothetical protein
MTTSVLTHSWQSVNKSTNVPAARWKHLMVPISNYLEENVEDKQSTSVLLTVYGGVSKSAFNDLHLYNSRTISNIVK